MAFLPALLAVVLLLLPAPGLGGSFLHVTDVHLDEHYVATADPGTQCHRGSGSAGQFGVRNECDTPLATLYATQGFLTGLPATLDFIVWTGDNARHDHDSKRQPQSLAEIVDEVRATTDAVLAVQVAHGGIPVIPSIGNNDVFPHDTLAPAPNAVLDALAEAWAPLLDANATASLRASGWFARDLPGLDLVVVSLNTLYFAKLNSAVHSCNHDSSPGAAHIAWLASLLAGAQRQGRRVLLTGHVPPSGDYWHDACQAAYLALSDQYADVVMGHLYGHTHMDSFAVLSHARAADGALRADEAQVVASLRRRLRGLGAKCTTCPPQCDLARPVAVILTAPAVYEEFNPAVRVFSYEGGRLLDYMQYYADLDDANKRGSMAWQLEYSARDAYAVQALDVTEMAALCARMQSNAGLLQLYWRLQQVSVPGT